MKKPLEVIKFIINTLIVLIVTVIVLLFIIQKCEYIEGVGVLLPERIYNIYSPVAGEIEKVNKEFGDKVKKNEMILQISDLEARNQLMDNTTAISNIKSDLKEKDMEIDNLRNQENEQETKLNITEMDLKKLRDEYETSKYLVSIGAKSRQELNDVLLNINKKESELALLKSEENVKAKEVSIYQAKESLQNQYNFLQEKRKQILQGLRNRKIKSKVNNFTLITKGLKEQEGAFVNKGTYLCTLANLNKFRMEVVIKENEIGKVKLGQKAKIFIDAVPYEKFATLDGKVIKLYPQAVGREETYDKVELEIEGFTNRLSGDKLKQVNLKSGLKGTARIMVKKKKMLALFLLDKIFE